MSVTGYPSDAVWKRLFLIFSVAIIIIMPVLSKDYGQSGDEWLQILYGEHIWNYHTEGDPQALDYNNKSLQYQGMEYYGGLFDFSMHVLHRMFPSMPILILRHIFNSLCGAILMIFTGLLAFRLSKKWSVGFLALLFIFFSPRIFGESMNNPKDIPLACGFTVAIYSLIALLQDTPRKIWKHAVGIGLGFTLAFGVRSAGGLLLVAFMVFFTAAYYFLHKDFRQVIMADNKKLLKKMALAVVLVLAVGYAIAMFAWPWGLQNPLTSPFDSLKRMTNLAIQITVLFEGKYAPNSTMPWYYEFKWIMMSNPLIVIAGVVLFAVLLLRVKKVYGLFPVIVVVFGAFFPLLYMIYKKSSVYDTWRHVFFVYPYWVCMSALAFGAIEEMITNAKLKLIPVAIAVLGLLPAIIWTVKSHPNQYVYFNEAVGGPAGAYGYYDLDYYQNSGKQAADWIRENVKPVPGRKIRVLSNMVGFDKYFANDTNWIDEEYGRFNARHHLDWDYYIAYPRYVPAAQMQNGIWGTKNVVHSIEVDGVPLSVIFQRNSKAGVEANEAYEKKDYATAAQKYREYIQADDTDENVLVNYGISLAYTGQMDAAIAAITRATELDPSRPDYYKILAQLYQAKGDMQGAQRASATAQSIIMEQQEDRE